MEKQLWANWCIGAEYDFALSPAVQVLTVDIYRMKSRFTFRSSTLKYHMLT